MDRILIVLALVFNLIGCTGQPIYDIDQEQIPNLRDGGTPSISQVEKAIIVAAQKRGWSPRIISTGLIEARITVRSHRAIIEIPYTEKSYSIRYKDSTNLDYSNEKIHKNYNKWIIKRRVQFRESLACVLKTTKPNEMVNRTTFPLALQSVRLPQRYK